MANTCIEQHTPYLAARHKELVDSGMPNKEAAIKVAIEEHKKLHDELNDLKKSISPDPKKFVPSEYISPDTSPKVKEIKDRYDNIIKNTKISEDELIISEDKAENDAAIAKLTEEDNIEQEPNVQAIEGKAENANGIGSKELNEALNQANELINAAIDVVNVPISEIKTNEQEYQGRKNKFSERSARKVAEQFDKNKLLPITVYKHPDGNTYVLSGHSRLEGMKRRNATTIPATYFEGTPQEAIDFSLTSNKQGSLQTDIENAAYYRKKLLVGESYNALLKEAKENEQEGSAKRIISIAHLNPNGKAMQDLEALDKGEGDSKNNILNIATKIGDIRAKNEHLTNAHENELYEFMAADKKNIPTDKDLANPSNTLNRSINNAKFTPEEPLNLDRVVNKSDNRIQWEKELRELEAQQAELKLAVNPSKKTGWTGLKEKAIATLAKGDNSKDGIDKAVLAFENNENGIKDAYQKQIEIKRGELASVNDKLAKHLLREKDLIQGDKAQQSLFAIQQPTSQAISDMRDIVKDYVDEGTNSVEQIQNEVAKELGDNSQEMRDLVEKAYNEFYNTKESTPIEVTSSVIGKVGKFLSRLFGGTAASKVYIAKDEKALMDKYDSVVKDGDSVNFQRVSKKYQKTYSISGFGTQGDIKVTIRETPSKKFNDEGKITEQKIFSNLAKAEAWAESQGAIFYYDYQTGEDISNSGGDTGLSGRTESSVSDMQAPYKIKIKGQEVKVKPIKAELKAQVVAGLPLFMKSPDGKILGFSYEGKVYLNGEAINSNTPIHEAGHIWLQWAKQNNAEVYNRGIELTKNSKYLKAVKENKFYQQEAEKLPPDQREEYFQQEALAMAIGDKGAQFVGETRKKDFKEWLNNLWNKIKEIAGFKDITAAELQNLTFDEFAKRAAADILRDEEVAQPQGQQQGTGAEPSAAPQPKVKTKLTDVELGVIREVLESTIDARQYPTFFDMNQTLIQQTAKTQGEGQERVPLDGTYVQAHLADLRSISLNNARVLQDALGSDWKEKMINFFEENPKAGDIAVVSGILNVMNTDINNEIAASKNGTEISKLKDLQARADRITYDTARSASLALNQRRMYQDFGQGKTVADILSSIILTPEQQDIKRKVEEALKQKFTDEELNKPKPAKPKKAAQPKKQAPKNEDSVKKDLISKGKKAAQQTDADGNVTTASLKDKIQQANDALNGFKC